MTRVDASALRLQPDLSHLPFGGAWWPRDSDPSSGLLDLLERWPAGRVAVSGYAYLPVDWDTGPRTVPDVDVIGGAAQPHRLRTRTLVLRMADLTACRILVIPNDASREVAERLLAEAGDPASRWRRADFDREVGAPVTHEHRVLRADETDA